MAPVKTLFSLLLTSCCLLIASASFPAVNAGGQGKHDQENSAAKVEYTGNAVAIGGQFGGNRRSFTLEITANTLDPQAQQDFQILQTGGQDALMKAISKDKQGFLAFDGQVGRDLNFVQETETEDGRNRLWVASAQVIWLVQPFEGIFYVDRQACASSPIHLYRHVAADPDPRRGVHLPYAG